MGNLIQKFDPSDWFIKPYFFGRGIMTQKDCGGGCNVAGCGSVGSAARAEP